MMFLNDKLLIVTKHGKEKIIAPVMEKELGVRCVVSEDFDTDQFGTFSGEIQREDGPITTVRKKCLAGMQLSQCELAIASEGSFGPHPGYCFVAVNEELLIFIDKRSGLEVLVREVSTDTNFNGSEITTEAELMAFAETAGFPSHGLIIKNSKDNFTETVKGIISPEHLRDTFNHFISKYGKLFVETDMRAMYNPSRMRVIEKAAIQLAEKIKSRCPACDFPGFGIVSAQPGLPCELCNRPTNSTLSHVYACKKCKHRLEKKYPNNKQTEEAMYCDACNP